MEKKEKMTKKKEKEEGIEKRRRRSRRRRSRRSSRRKIHTDWCWYSLNSKCTSDWPLLTDSSTGVAQSITSREISK
jgi:hypothetical protein